MASTPGGYMSESALAELLGEDFYSATWSESSFGPIDMAVRIARFQGACFMVPELVHIAPYVAQLGLVPFYSEHIKNKIDIKVLKKVMDVDPHAFKPISYLLTCAAVTAKVRHEKDVTKRQSAIASFLTSMKTISEQERRDLITVMKSPGTAPVLRSAVVAKESGTGRFGHATCLFGKYGSYNIDWTQQTSFVSTEYAEMKSDKKSLAVVVPERVSMALPSKADAGPKAAEKSASASPSA